MSQIPTSNPGWGGLVIRGYGVVEFRRVIGDGSVSLARWPAITAFALAVVAYAVLQLGALGHPLFWQDEGETAMFARRILDHGYPKVHGAEGVVYGMGVPLELAVDSQHDAYLGSLWGQYYWAALGVAWSDGAVDIHTRTWRVRLPFVLAGMAGLACLLAAMRDELANRSGTALPAAAVFVLFLCLSTSLQLHLREVRYYAPTVGLVGGAILLDRQLMRAVAGRRSWLIGAALTLVLCLLLNVFYPAGVALIVWLAVETGLDMRRDDGWRGARARTVQRLIPVAVASVVAVPLAVYFDVFALSRVFSERWGFGPDVYLANLGHLVWYLLRYELLGLVVLAELLLAMAVARVSLPSRREPARRVALSLLRLIIVYALIGVGNPIFFERYFVPIGPLLAMVVVLDVTTLLRRLSQRETSNPGSGIRHLVVGALVVGLIATVAVRRVEFLGRIREIVVPVEGPIDHVVAALQAEYADTRTLVIATNYESEPLMFYLGSRVVGRFHSALPEAIAGERAERPDVVVLRTGHGKRLEEVRRYLLSGGFVRRTLPIADTPYNTIPELYRGRVLDRTHWFVTPRPGPSEPPLAIYERRT